MIPEVTEAIRDVSLDEAAPPPAVFPATHLPGDGRAAIVLQANGTTQPSTDGQAAQRRVRCV